MSYRSAVHETTKVTPVMLMFGRELRVPLDILLGRPQADLEEQSYLEYAKILRASIATVHDFARDHQQASSQRMKRRYDIRSEPFTFSKGELVWLYNPQRKKGKSPKLRRPWEGPYVVVERLNDVVYRIQRGPRAKPKVAHRHRLWQYRADACAHWFNEPAEGQGANLPEGASARKEPWKTPLRETQHPVVQGGEGVNPQDSDKMFPLPVMSRRKHYDCRGATTTSGVRTGVGEDPSDIVTLLQVETVR